MRRVFLFLILSAWSASGAESALEALAHLPKDQAAHLARIEGRGGSPAPDRWYFLVYDPAAETGVHEFVVADGQVVASRALSQFADSLKPEEVMDPASLKTDSAQAAKLAAAYAAANGVNATSINYELRNGDGAPAWKLSCLNDAGTSLGEVTVAAQTGEVLAHGGFIQTPREPAATPKPAHAGRAAAGKTPRFDVYAEPVVAPGAVPTPGLEADNAPHRRRTRPPQGGAIGGAFKNVGRKLHNFFAF